MGSDHERITRLLEQAAHSHAEFERCQREAAGHEAARDAALAEAASLFEAEDAEGESVGDSITLVNDPPLPPRARRAS